jgi:hypothetical protein
MTWLLIVLLALTVSISGCNKTGYECPTCEGEVAGTAPACPHCGQVFDVLGVTPRALDSEYVTEQSIEIDDVESGYSDHQRRLIEDAKQNKGPPDYSHLKVDLPPPTEEEINMGRPDGSNGFGGGSGAEGGGQGGSDSRGSFDPEAIFTRLDENGDGQLEGDEISERLAQRMEQTDTNGDGKISKEEFLAAIRQRFRGGAEGQNPGIPSP